MTKQEALATIEDWIKTYSLFTAEAVSVTPRREWGMGGAGRM
jgi:hypothetical protein